MKGRWAKTGFRHFTLRTATRSHAVVRFDEQYFQLDPTHPWVVWTYHTEGNDHFATAREAKLHARKRLRALLEATEELR